MDSNNKNISVKNFADDIQKNLQEKELDVEINILNYKEYKFNFSSGKFERTQKTLIPVINGLGNVNLEDKEKFRDLNMLLYSNYETSKLSQNQKLNFKIRYSPINRHYIAGDKINKKLDNIIDYGTNEKISLSLNESSKFSLLIFTTPLHFNYNPDVIKKLEELEKYSNLNIFLVFITDKKKNDQYDKICEQFIEHYKFTNLKYLIFPNYDDENLNQYKNLNLSFDLTDPSKICYFINIDGLILSDFVEFSQEKFEKIKSTLDLNDDKIFIQEIKSTKTYNYKNVEQFLNPNENSNSSITPQNLKSFNSYIKNFSYDQNLKQKKNNFLIIQIHKYFDINKDNAFTNERVEKINILYALNKKYSKIYENFISNLNISETFKKCISIRGTILDHRQKLINTLKFIRDDLIQNNIEEKLLSNKSLDCKYKISVENENKKKSYSLVNKIPVYLLCKNIENNIFPQLLKLNELENEISKDQKSPAYIFDEFYLIPRLHPGDKFVPINKKFLSSVEELKYFDSQENEYLENINLNNISLPMIYYFFTSWSGPSISYLKDLNKLAEEFKDKLKIYAFCVDSHFEELKENLIYNLFGDLKNIKFEIYFTCTQKDKSFEIYQKLYRAYRVNNSLVLIDKSGLVNLIENCLNVKNLKEKISELSIINSQNLIKEEENQQENNLSSLIDNKIIKNSSNFYDEIRKSINYSHEFKMKAISNIFIGDDFKIIDDKIQNLEINCELRKEENDKLLNFINSFGILDNIKFSSNTLETINLTNFFKKIQNDSQEEILCSLCKVKFQKDQSQAIYYCHTCDDFTCTTCQPKHEHNLILSRIGNPVEHNFMNIDLFRLGDNLAFYGTMKSKNHQAGCNKCENLINNCARFICLNCVPGKVSEKTGYNDYCENCINTCIEKKWKNLKPENLQNKQCCNSDCHDAHGAHDELNHIYLRLDYSVTYFSY
jgi:thiol-disulfide isomerase/thioredoxin